VDSFFDIYTEVTLDGQTLYPATPLHLQSVNQHKPPARGEAFVDPSQKPVELIDGSGKGTGIFISDAAHTPNPMNGPLQVICSADIVVTATNVAGAVVIFDSSTSGGCQPVTLTCNPASGSTFPIGTTTVTCTASDACDNRDVCSFTVTVERPKISIGTGGGGGQLKIEWTSGTVQEADSVEGPYIDVDPQPSSPWTITPGEIAKFFRIRG